MKIDKKAVKRCFVIILATFAICVFLVIMVNYRIQQSSKNFIYNAADVPAKQVALLLGAGVHENGRLSDMFRDRNDVAIELYESGKVQKILVSGDHGRKEYDEVNAAKEYLLSNGVEGKDVSLDHAGFDTYDSIYRARDIFQVDSMIIVTQGYHLPRALYIAKSLGMDAVGADAELRTYGREDYRNFREKFAVAKACLDVASGAKPKFLGEAIPISGEGFGSWD